MNWTHIKEQITNLLGFIKFIFDSVLSSEKLQNKTLSRSSDSLIHVILIVCHIKAFFSDVYKIKEV